MILEENGIENEILILPDTGHNLGLYYERSASRMLAFLGSHLKERHKSNTHRCARAQQLQLWHEPKWPLANPIVKDDALTM